MLGINDHFNIGPITFYWYGIIVVLGFFASVLFTFLEWKKKGYSKYHFNNMFWVTLVAGLWGARVWFLIFNPSDITSFFSFFQVSQGRSILGSIFFIWLGLFLYTKFLGPDIEFRYVISIVIPNMLIGQAIGRWGNFVDQNVYGLIVNNPNGGIFGFLPNFIKDAMFIDGSYRQPLFLYESLINLLGWFLIAIVAKRFYKIKPGTHFSLYMIWYGVTRASMENFRADEYIMKIGNFHTSFWLAIMFIFIGIITLIYYQFTYKQTLFFFKYKAKFYFSSLFKIIFSKKELREEYIQEFKLENNFIESKRESFNKSILDYYFR